MRVMHRPVLTLLVFVLLAVAGFAEDLAETKKKAEAGDANAQAYVGQAYRFGLSGMKINDYEALK